MERLLVCDILEANYKHMKKENTDYMLHVITVFHDGWVEAAPYLGNLYLVKAKLQSDTSLQIWL